MSESKRQRMAGASDYYGGGPDYGSGQDYGAAAAAAAAYSGSGSYGAGGPMGYGAPMGGPMGAGMGGMGGAMGAGMGGMVGMGAPDMGPGGGVASERMFPCVKLRGLPFECFEDDVCMFLGLDPIDILMVKRNGRFSGEAYVLLGTPLHVEYALQKNKMNMGRRYIEVFRAKRWDYYKAVAGEVTDGLHAGYGGPPMGGYDVQNMGGIPPGAQGMGGMGGDPRGMAPAMSHLDVEHTGVLKLRGLPYSATPHDILQWFNDPSINLSAPLTLDSVRLCLNHSGRPSGSAFVEFPTPDDSREAMIKHRQMLGSRYIELFPSSREDMARATGIRMDPPAVVALPP